MQFTSKSIINLISMIDKKHEGILYPIEPPMLPFDISRIFWTYGVKPKGIRGGHAHKECIQFYICIKGCIGIRCNDSKDEFEVFIKEGQALLIDKLVWTEETFMTGDDILLVLCSTKYDSNDYLNTVQDLKRFIENG